MKRAAFFGASLPTARRGAVAAARTPQLVVRAAQQISADVEKPIGLTFKESKAKGGGLVVTVSSYCVFTTEDGIVHIQRGAASSRRRVLTASCLRGLGCKGQALIAAWERVP